MEAIKEREQFSKRLKEALKRAEEVSDSPAALARAFNRRYPGEPVSDYAARKWLLGESIPSQDKLRVLAKWLGVANDWLRFGDGAKPGKHVVREDSSMPDYELMRAIAILSEDHQTVVRELVAALRRAEKQ
jgi:transcriptional regulator with XRE-family HTH domain